MKKLEDYTIEELKALAYDSLVAIENYQANLKIINTEISKRQQNIKTDSEVVASQPVADMDSNKSSTK